VLSTEKIREIIERGETGRVEFKSEKEKKLKQDKAKRIESLKTVLA